MKHLTKHLSLIMVLSTIFYLTSASDDTPCEIHIEGGVETSDCPSLHSCINGFCVHKSIFPLETIEYPGTIILMFLAGLANAGGLGGGALLSPILLVFFNYDTSKAIMITYSIVFGGSLGNFLNVAFQRHPTTKRSFVDYDLTLICMPVMIAGANTGVLLNRISPSAAILIGLVCTMIYTGKKVYLKAKNTYAAETNQRSQSFLSTEAAPQEASKEENSEISISQSRDSFYYDDIKSSMPTELQAILREDKQLFPPLKLLIVFAMLAFNVLIMILKGSKSSHSLIGLEYCEKGYWLVFIIGMIGCYGFYRLGMKEVNKRLEIKRENNYKTEGSGFTLTEDLVQKVGGLSFLAGIAAGLLGLGGGMVMSPFLLQLGMEPQTLAATVGFFVVQTSFITLFQSFYAGDVSGVETIFFLSAALVGSIGVSMLLNYIVRKYDRPSLMLFALSFVILLSLIVMPTFAVYKSIDDPEEMLEIGSVC